MTHQVAAVIPTSLAGVPLAELAPAASLFTHDSTLHGQSHVARVMVHAFRLLSQTGWMDHAPRLWAAVYLHDLARTHDGECHRHGADAMDKFESLPELRELFARGGVDDADYAAIHTAVVHHCRSEELDGRHPHWRLTALLKDADGLDRVRLGDLDPRYFRHRKARRMVRFATELFDKTGSVPVGPGHFAELWTEAVQIADALQRTRRHAPSLRIPLTVTRCAVSEPQGRVRYQSGDRCLIPEEIVLQRWKERSRTDPALASGTRFDGCRLPPGTWALLRAWMAEGLRSDEFARPAVLKEYAERNQAGGGTLRAPVSSKFTHLLTFLAERKLLQCVVERERSASSPGLPDLFLYRMDIEGRVFGGRFVEVKRHNQRTGDRERISPTQAAELEFLRTLGLEARVVYLLE